MSQNICLRMEKSKIWQNIIALSVSLLICALLSGCTHIRASTVSRQPTGTPIKASDVKFVSSFKEINEPWRLEGMFSGYLMPGFKDNLDNRVTYIKQKVADLGINTVVGLQPRVGEGVCVWNVTNGIMANVGSAQQQNTDPLPKFIVCLPPVNFKIENTPALGNLDGYLRGYIQFLLGYGRGYYAYHSNATGMDNNTILQGSASLGALSEPIGIEPDYAMLCDVDGYDVEGNIVISRTHTLKLTITLYDLKDKKPVWTRSTEGISSKSLLVTFLTGGLAAGAADLSQPDDLTAVARALEKAMKDLPAVKGFKQSGEGWFPI
jgi:hypothetical protein